MTETTPSFDVLADGLKASDHDAYAALFKLMHEPLLRYTFRITRDEALCLDILQDVFMKLWEKRHQLEIRVSLKALLYTMARNQALNAIRGTGKTIEINQIDCAKQLAIAPGAEKKLAAKQLNAYFKSWINELPPRRAEAFILSRHHDFSHLEISNIMGLSKRTIDTHITHALRFLRERFEKLQKQGMES
ncbi:MAG: RNA polymerase sigma factor [Rhodothermales bacterium]